MISKEFLPCIAGVVSTHAHDAQVRERVAARREKRQAADAAQRALLEAKAREQDQFELIKAEYGVDTATVRFDTLATAIVKVAGDWCFNESACDRDIVTGLSGGTPCPNASPDNLAALLVATFDSSGTSG